MKKMTKGALSILREKIYLRIIEENRVLSILRGIFNEPAMKGQMRFTMSHFEKHLYIKIRNNTSKKKFAGSS